MHFRIGSGVENKENDEDENTRASSWLHGGHLYALREIILPKDEARAAREACRVLRREPYPCLIGIGGGFQGPSRCCCMPLGQHKDHFSLRLLRARGLLLGFEHQLFEDSAMAHCVFHS